MTLVREKVPQEEWEYFNSLNIQFENKHITADYYSTWVIDRDREMIFTRVQTPGRDYGETFILIWGNSRIYIYVEAHSRQPGSNGMRTFHWDIQRITAPITLKNKKDELIRLIQFIAEINYDRRGAIDRKNPTVFVIDQIADPIFSDD